MKVLKAALDAMKGGSPAVLCTVIGIQGSAPRSTSARMLVYDTGDIVGTVGGGEWERRLIEAALEALEEGKPRRVQLHLTRDLGMCCGGAMEAYVEPLETLDHVHLFGAGHVGGAVAPLLVALGFEVLVYDDREEWLTEARFPGCTLVPGDPARKSVALSPEDYALIITHSHDLDQRLLEALIVQPYRYLGMIGSRSKVTKFFLRLRSAGIDPSLFERVSAPVGLDIGAETPAEIAVAIAAELVRVRRGHTEAPLPLSARSRESVEPA